MIITTKFPIPIPRILYLKISGIVERGFENFHYFLCGPEIPGEKTCHNSMLVHITRYTAVQSKLADMINEKLISQRPRFEYEKAESENSIYREMEGLWKADFDPQHGKY